jgi:hypothetical protein
MPEKLELIKMEIFCQFRPIVRDVDPRKCRVHRVRPKLRAQNNLDWSFESRYDTSRQGGRFEKGV